jgi:glucose-1-phosphate adenylyltransferase
MSKAFAMIMAGGPNRSLSALTEVRVAPAIPFGGKYRLIDFSLSNCVNSEIFNVAVLTQYLPQSLSDHLGTGAPWDLDLMTGGLRVLHPYTGGRWGDWQKGTADAVRRNLDYVKEQPEENVLILSGDHIYLMDYRPFLRQHERTGADLTLAVRRVSPHDAHRFGMVALDPEERVVGFEEKPRRARDSVASMGIYVFKKSVLIQLLEKTDAVDFGRHLVPQMVKERYNVRGFHFPGYWTDAGTVQAYWEASMSLLAENPALDLYDTDWTVLTRSMERAPVKIGANAKVDGNILSNGCRIDGVIEQSIVSPGVYVAEGAVVRNSILLHDTIVHPGAIVDRCIVDKSVVIGPDARVGHGDDNTANHELPERLNTGLTIVGKDSFIPSKAEIGRNVVIHPGSHEELFGKKKRYGSGASVGKQLAELGH